MDAGDRDVRNAQIALVSSAEFQDLVSFGDDDGDGRILVLILDFLQNDEGTSGLLNGDQIVVPLLEANRAGKVLETEFALEFGPLVSGDVHVVLGNNFVLDPPLETEEVDEVFADTGKEFRVFHDIFAHVVEIAVLAHLLVLPVGIGLGLIPEDLVVGVENGLLHADLEVIQFLLRVGGSVFGLDLHDPILDATQLDHVAGAEGEAALVSPVSLFQGTDDEIGWIGSLVFFGEVAGNID